MNKFTIWRGKKEGHADDGVQPNYLLVFEREGVEGEQGFNLGRTRTKAKTWLKHFGEQGSIGWEFTGGEEDAKERHPVKIYEATKLTAIRDFVESELEDLHEL